MTKLWQLPKIQRMHVIQSQLARLPETPAEDPLVTARKAKEAAARLAAQDALFGTYWGCTLGALAPRISAGDDARGVGGNDD